MLRTVAEIRDPVHGYIKMTEVEREVIDSPEVQRLRRIHQLAGAFLVYPGAVHTRFEHVVGAMHVAGTIAQSLAEYADLTNEQIQEIRLAALLHDVGHGPFSHLFEEVLSAKTKLSHEDITTQVISKTQIKDILGRNGFSSNSMSSFAVGDQKRRPRFMNEIISGGLSADLMDYLLRDSYFTGVEYGKVDINRIISSLSIAENRLALRSAALYAFEAMLLARYQMFKTVYFHRTVRAAQLMLVHSMILADDSLHLTSFSDINKYLELTDEGVLQKLVSLDASNKKMAESRQLARDFRDRRLVKCVYERLMLRKDRAVQQLFERGEVRDQLLLDISAKAKVNRIHIFLDVPTVPSVPYTSFREMFTSIIVDHAGEAGAGGGQKSGRERPRFETVPLSQLPLVGSIAGFMNILRVYTKPENRLQVFEATRELLGDKVSLIRE